MSLCLLEPLEYTPLNYNKGLKRTRKTTIVDILSPFSKMTEVLIKNITLTSRRINSYKL